MTEMQLSPERENAIRYLVTRVYSLSPTKRLSKKMIFKILYELKKSLPDGHPLKGHLQYYWYRHGVNSDFVDAAIYSMKRNGWLLQRIGQKSMTLASNAPTLTVGDDADRKIVDDGLIYILASIDFTDPGDFYNSIYQTDAPLEFIKRFGSDFFNAIGMNVPREEADDFFRESILPNVPAIQALLYSCETVIPDDPLFDEYKPLFSTYAVATDRLLDYIRNDGDKGNLLMWNVRHDTEEMWNGFVLGSRILNVCHDEEYDQMLDDWRRRFFENLDSLKSYVESFYEFSFEVVKDSCEYEPVDEASKRILKSMVDGHLNAR